MKKRYMIAGGMILYAVAQFDNAPPQQNAPSSTQSRQTNQQRERPPEKPSQSGTLVQPRVVDTRPSIAPVTSMRAVSGNRVAFRQGPSTTYRIIDRFDRGRRVQQLENQGEWSRVRDQITQREGWMASRFLSERLDVTSDTRAKSPPKPKQVPRSLPVVSTSVIIQRIIAESIAAYPGSCPCPYNTDRGGRRCGKRSAYSKPGGYAPICFSQDVTEAMIAAARQRR